MVDISDFRDAMSRLTGAVNVITTAGDSGRYGFTASAVCSVTDAPPTLLVCMNKNAQSHPHFLENKVLSVNVLGSQHQQISQAFASKLTAEERFNYGEWSSLETGSPILNDALVSFDCKIEQIQDVGTHAIFICQIEAIKQNEEGQGLVYFNRAYHPVGQCKAIS